MWKNHLSLSPPINLLLLLLLLLFQLILFIFQPYFCLCCFPLSTLHQESSRNLFFFNEKISVNKKKIQILCVASFLSSKARKVIILENDTHFRKSIPLTSYRTRYQFDINIIPQHGKTNLQKQYIKMLQKSSIPEPAMVQNYQTQVQTLEM